MAESAKFNIKRALQCVSESIASENEILMDKYIATYTELTKFIDLLGTVFGFVNKDVREKLTILTAHRSGPVAERYVSVQSMVEYEVSNKIVEKSGGKIPNGCRSLLRLHRALEFLMGFLAILQDIDSKVPLTTSVHECYKSTLAQHHSWLIQKGVGLALYTLPVKEKLIQMLSEDLQEGEFTVHTSEIVDKLKTVYASVQRCYVSNNIHDLP